jgi:hypothetical protein
MKNQPKADKADKDNKKQAASAMALPVDFHYKFCFRKPLTAPTNFKVVETCACLNGLKPINSILSL